MALLHEVNTRNHSKRAYYGLFIYEQSVVQCDRGAAYSIAGLVSLPRGLPLR